MSDQPTSLLERTRVLLDAAHGVMTAKQISKATGVSEAWLSRFQAGKIPNPGVNQIQKLYDYLVRRV